MATIGVTAAPGKAPSTVQRAWLRRALDQPGGKLPLFDANGRQIDARTIRSCIEQGWAEPWFDNPTKPDWLVCKLTAAGRTVLTRPSAPELAEATSSAELITT